MQGLRTILAMNAASCLGFGALFLLAPAAVSAFLSPIPAWLISVTSLALLGNGLHLNSARHRAMPSRWEVLWFSLGDMAWWLASAAILIWLPLSMAAKGATVIVATTVAAMGLAQLWHLARADRDAPFRDMIADWLALPLWVQAWLVALNLIFWLGFFRLPGEAAFAALVAYIASGPILIALALWSGGLTRIVGVGHLVPWLPLVPILWRHAAQPEAALLLGAVLICLIFDIYDLIRWLAGDRLSPTQRIT